MSDSNTNTNTAIVPEADPTSVTSDTGNPNSMRVHFEPGSTNPQVEYLKTEGSASVRNTADVQLPTAEHFISELAAHDAFISDAEARLAAQRHDRAGRPVGFEVEGRDRDNLVRQLETRRAAKAFTGQRLAVAHATATARAERRVEAAKAGEADTERNDVFAAARREALIAETAEDMGSDGKPLGRARATQLVDEELQRERVAARVRGRR